MAPIGRYQDWTVVPFSIFAVSSTICALIVYSLLIIWICVCGDSESAKKEKKAEAPNAGGQTPTVGKTGKDGAGGGRKEREGKNRDGKLEFVNVVTFDDGKKGLLTKDGTVPHPFTVKGVPKTSKQEKSTDSHGSLPTVMRGTGLSLPPSLHVPSGLTVAPSKALPDVKKASDIEKKTTTVPAVTKTKTAAVPIKTATTARPEPTKKIPEPTAASKAMVTKKPGKTVIVPSKTVIKKERVPVKPFAVAVTVRAPASPVASLKPSLKPSKSAEGSSDGSDQGPPGKGSSSKSPSTMQSVFVRVNSPRQTVRGAHDVHSVQVQPEDAKKRKR